MQLWAEHLRVAPGVVTNVVATARLLLSPGTSARVRPYDPAAGTDREPDFVCNVGFDTIDPFLACPEVRTAGV